MSDALSRLGREVGEALGDGPPAERLPRQRAALVVEAVARASGKRRGGRLWLALPALAAAAAIVVLSVYLAPSRGRPAPDPAVVASVEGAVVEPGAYLGGGGDDAVALRFSEGSEVSVEPGARARLARLESHEVHLSVESGALASAIVPRTGVQWTFLAGPYRVIVVGTRLRVEWRADEQRLEVRVTEGRVRVEGAELGASGLAVAAGQRLVAEAGGVHLTDDRAALASTEAEGRSSDQDDEPAGATASRLRASDRADGGAGEADAPWRALAERGRYDEAAAAAEAAGFDELTEELGAWDLLLLADAARLGGRPARARAALLALRRRFPGERAAHVAAFRLGRLAWDQERDPAEAARWFQTLLDEAPGDSTAPDARGRLMEALVRLGRRDEAVGVARDYLRRHPRGAYSAAARALLGGSEADAGGPG